MPIKKRGVSGMRSKGQLMAGESTQKKESSQEPILDVDRYDIPSALDQPANVNGISFSSILTNIALFIFVIWAAISSFLGPPVKRPPPHDAIHSPSLENAAVQFSASALALKDIAAFDESQALRRLSDAATAIRGSHDSVRSYRTFLITEVASTLRETKNSLSLSSIGKAEHVVDIAWQRSYKVVQSLNTTMSIATHAADTVAEVNGRIDAAKWDKWKELLPKSGWWTIPWLSQGHATALRESYDKLDDLSLRVFNVSQSLSSGVDAVEDEYDRFLELITDLKHVATQIRSFKESWKTPASSNKDEATVRSDKVGTELHAAILEQIFLNAIMANMETDNGTQAIEDYMSATVAKGSE